MFFFSRTDKDTTTTLRGDGSSETLADTLPNVPLKEAMPNHIGSYADAANDVDVDDDLKQTAASSRQGSPGPKMLLEDDGKHDYVMTDTSSYSNKYRAACCSQIRIR